MAEPTGFRRWRRTRPFWGAVFAVLGGLELILVPLAPIGISIHQGMPGVASWLCGAILIICGVLVCTQPQQRSFFGILSVLAALGSFVTSNLGGFLLGMLLGIAGGSMIFAWSSKAPRAPEQIIELPDFEPAAELDGPSSAEIVPGFAEPQAAPLDVRITPSPGPRHARGKLLAAGVLPAALSAHLVAGTTATPSPSPSPAASSTPTPAPSASSGTSSSGTTGTSDTGATTNPKAGSSSSSSCPEIPSSTLTADETKTLLTSLQSADSSCLASLSIPTSTSGSMTYSTQKAQLKASSLTMYGMGFDGVVDLPTSSGSVRAMKFSMTKAQFDDVEQTFGDSELTTPRLTFSSSVVLYATKMTGKLLGIPLTLTPDSPLLAVLKLLKLPVMAMTDVVSEQPAVTAGTADATTLGTKA